MVRYSRPANWSTFSLAAKVLITSLFLSALSVVAPITAVPAQAFDETDALVLVVDTNLGSNDLILPFSSSEAFDLKVDWGDGNIENPLTTMPSHTYTTEGTYTVKVTNSGSNLLRFGNASETDPNDDGSTNQLIVSAPNLPTWIDSYREAFADAINLVHVDGRLPAGATDLNSMFRKATVFNGDLSGWDTSNVTNMAQMFARATSFNSDLSGWDTSKVTDMNQMFTRATSFNSDISGWDTSKVTDMSQMFDSATSFNSDISRWDTGLVTNMDSTFRSAVSFNADISTWDTSEVTTLGSMFTDATIFNRNLDAWDVTKVNNMYQMFFGTSMKYCLPSWTLTANGPTNLKESCQVITLNTHGGTDSSYSYKNGWELPVPDYRPTKAGSFFLGWYDAATDGSKIAFPYTPIADVTFHAQWAPDTEQLIVPCSTSGDFVIIDKAVHHSVNCQGHAEIPYGVTSIAEYAFSGSGVTTVTIPESVTSIGTEAFYNSVELTEVTIPAGVTSLPNWVFGDCTKLESVVFVDRDSIISFGEYAFSGTALRSFTIPSGVTSIARSMFEASLQLASISLHEGITSIGKNAFKKTAIPSFTVPSRVTEIPESLFEQTSALASVTLHEGVTQVGSNAFAYTSLTHLTIPAGVTEIPSQLLSGATQLSSITIPEGVTSIGLRAFENNSSLAAITLPESLISIGDYAFRNSGLSSIALPAGLVSVGINPFFGTSVLGTENCPSGGTMSTIGTVVVASSNCVGAVIPAGTTVIASQAFKASAELSLTSLTIPATVKSIGYQAFSATKLVDLVFEADSSLKIISAEAFLSAVEMKSITIPKSVLEIGSKAFNGAASLESVVFEADSMLSSIGELALARTALTTIALPEGLVTLGNKVFEFNIMTEFQLPVSATQINPNALYGSSFTETLVNCSDGGTVAVVGTMVTYTRNCAGTAVIPAGVTHLARNAFRDLSGLTEVTLPNSVVVIGKDSFTLVPALTSIVFEGDAPNLGLGVFANMNSEAVFFTMAGATGFDDAQIWGSLPLSLGDSGATVAPVAPYYGPTATGYSVKSPAIGQSVTLFGERLDLVASVTIDSIEASITSQSSSSLTIVIPKLLQPGLKDLVIRSSLGALTVQGAFNVLAEVDASENAPESASAISVRGSTKKLTDSKAKIYAKDLVGAGKVQIFFNGKEIAWVRATSETDSKLRTANGAHYLVRTVELIKGRKNVLEVYVDGIRVKRVAYSY